jgi:phosphatidylethanolamine-binding protein (PEBP) family uncharacterized protein
VAQRTSAKRFLVPLAKVTSARVSLALVAAGLLLGGCGGSSSGSGEASTASTATANQKDDAAPTKTSQKQAATQGPAPAAPQASPAPHADPATQGKKHGLHIAQPKGPPEQAPTPAQIANATVADISLTSPSVPAGPGGPAPLPSTYTCDVGGKWPSLAWSGVPAGSAELILYAMNIAPVAGKLFVDWAVAGIDPALSGIEAGKLPKGSVVGTNSLGKQGYEICPEGGETYIFALYALPTALSPKPGFDARDLRQQILDVSGNVGLFPVTYTRG